MSYIGTKTPERHVSPLVKIFTENIKTGATNTFIYNIGMSHVVLAVFFLMILMTVNLTNVLLL